MSFLRRGVIVIIVLYTFSEEAELNGSTGKQDAV